MTTTTTTTEAQWQALRAALLAKVTGATEAALVADPTALAPLRAGLLAAVTEWPDITVEVGHVAAVVAAALAPDGPPPHEVIRGLALADLCLASACLAHDARALRVFEVECIQRIGAQVARLRLSPDAVAEVQQIVRERLLVGSAGRPPRLADYAAIGSLQAWVRVIAVRVALDQHREGQRARPELEQLAHDLPDEDPWLAGAKATYRVAFREAFATAFAALAPRLRLVLRFQVLDGLDLETIGAMYGVHAATVSRWSTAARHTLLEATRAELGQALGLGEEELASAIRLIQTNFDVSLRRLLTEVPAETP